jgi:hypothetical protein
MLVAQGVIRQNMHAQKLNSALRKLAQAPADIQTFVQAAALLDELDFDNHDCEEGERPNATVTAKLRETRSWFAVLSGVGEDGNWREEDVRLYIGHALSTIDDNIDGPHVRRWKAVGSGPP